MYEFNVVGTRLVIERGGSGKTVRKDQFSKGG